MNPVISFWLWCLTWVTAPRAQCTRCGGDHSLSQCRWPAIIEDAPGCGGACNQGRTKCTCR